MPVGGQLVLKGGQAIGVQKKKRKQKRPKPAAGDDKEEAGGPETTSSGAKIVPESITTDGKTYEQSFDLEQARRGAPKMKSTPWGSSYRAPPPDGVLHGYDRRVTGATASERLDIRCATKADKFCK